MKHTQKEYIIMALVARGETLVKKLQKRDVYSRSRGPGTFYYVGRGGSLRVGSTIVGSIPVSEKFKVALIERGRSLTTEEK